MLRVYFLIWFFGKHVGTDAFGNLYYCREKSKGQPSRQRRWVKYAGLAEPSKIPRFWFGWLHHTVEAPPTKVTQLPYFWEKPHQPNLTGTPHAHQPVLKGEGGADYTAWSPAATAEPERSSSGSLRGP